MCGKKGRISNISDSVHTINSSIETGAFSSEIEVALVISLHMKGDSGDLNNYRSISLLSLFCKIIEIIMKALRKTIWVYCKPIFWGCLVAFLFNSIWRVKQKWTCQWYVIDITKAFDSVDHTPLLDYIWEAGVRGTTFKLLDSRIIKVLLYQLNLEFHKDRYWVRFYS